MYAYMLKIYSDEGLKDVTDERQRLIKYMAMGKDFRPIFENISLRLKTYASVRDVMKGEPFIHGFCLSALADSGYFLSESESDTVNGFSDLLLIARKEVNVRWKHSYLIELKYAKKNSSEEVESLRQDAIAQLRRYALSPKLQARLHGTVLHKIVAVFQGADIAVCEEVE
jgi:hypothetical protein